MNNLADLAKMLSESPSETLMPTLINAITNMSEDFEEKPKDNSSRGLLTFPASSLLAAPAMTMYSLYNNNNNDSHFYFKAKDIIVCTAGNAESATQLNIRPYIPTGVIKVDKNKYIPALTEVETVGCYDLFFMKFEAPKNTTLQSSNYISTSAVTDVTVSPLHANNIFRPLKLIPEFKEYFIKNADAKPSIKALELLCFAPKGHRVYRLKADSSTDMRYSLTPAKDSDELYLNDADFIFLPYEEEEQGDGGLTGAPSVNSLTSEEEQGDGGLTGAPSVNSLTSEEE